MSSVNRPGRDCHWRATGILIFLLLVVSIVPATAFAQGKLDRFEEGLGDKAHSRSQPSREHGIRDDDTCSCVADFLFRLTGDVVSSLLGPGSGDHPPVTTGVWDRDSSGFARADVFYQNVESDVDGRGVNVQAGYHSLVLISFAEWYYEDEPRDKLRILEAYLQYRLPIEDALEIDFGAGYLGINGDRNHDNAAIVFSVAGGLGESIGLECRVAFDGGADNSIMVLDGAVLVGIEHVSLRAGYRLVRAYDQSLDGPHIGLSVLW